MRSPLSPRERGRNQNHNPLPGERVPDGGGQVRGRFQPHSTLTAPCGPVGEPGFLATGWEGRGLTGCGKTLQCFHPKPIRCHSERREESRSAAQDKLREGSRSEYFQGNARFFVAAAPQNDSAFEFFRSLLSPALPAASNRGEKFGLGISLCSSEASVLSQQFAAEFAIVEAEFPKPRQGRHPVAHGVSHGIRALSPFRPPLPPGRERG